MSKLYINGYDAFVITAKKQGQDDKVFNFSPGYEAMKEYYEPVATVDEWDDGSKDIISHFIRYEWEILYISRIDAPDLLKFGELENLQIQGWTLYLTVHKDNLDRIFKVILKPEKHEIDLFAHFGGKDSTPNKGYKATLLNKDSITEVSMTDMDVYVSGIGGTEGNPNKGQVQT